MPIGLPGGVLRDLRVLWDAGAAASRTDAELLERASGRRDDPGAEVAFAALVARHGPMVLATCLRRLGHRQDAEDAFQAVFLILARRAGTLRVGDSLGPWLHEVARRTALTAARASRRRRLRESSDFDPSTLPAPDLTSDETRPTIDEELARLPAGFRAAVVLCDLEGLTIEAAARQLGCPAGTIRSRLARGRERLRSRLARRGLGTLSSIPALFPSPTVPFALIESTSRAGTVASGGRMTVGLVSESVAAILQGVSTTMILTRYKPIATALLVLAFGAGGLAYQATVRQGKSPEAGTTSQATTGEPRPVAPDTDSFAAKKGEVQARAAWDDKMIEDKLARPVVLDQDAGKPFTLENLLKAVRGATEGPEGVGIPIYVDPVGLEDANVSILSGIDWSQADPKRSLRDNLRGWLLRLNLDCYVESGLLKVSSKGEVLLHKIEGIDGRIDRLTRRLEAAEERAARAAPGR